MCRSHSPTLPLPESRCAFSAVLSCSLSTKPRESIRSPNGTRWVTAGGCGSPGKACPITRASACSKQVTLQYQRPSSEYPRTGSKKARHRLGRREHAGESQFRRKRSTFISGIWTLVQFVPRIVCRSKFIGILSESWVGRSRILATPPLHRVRQAAISRGARSPPFTGQSQGKTAGTSPTELQPEPKFRRFLSGSQRLNSLHRTYDFGDAQTVAAVHNDHLAAGDHFFPHQKLYGVLNVLVKFHH
jgi:hypothetical protein